MKTLMGIYKDIRFLRGSRLIESKDNKLKINYDFFLELFEKLTERESAGLFAHKSKVENICDLVVAVIIEGMRTSLVWQNWSIYSL